MASENDHFDVSLKVWGDLACFTRPEFHVERVTYPVMTPSSARGVLESICWKPEMRWEIREIWVLNPIQEIVMVRNELQDRQSDRLKGVYYIEDRRQQRSSLCLKEPSYIIHADIRLKSHTASHKRKYIEQFNRRINRGECHNQPYLGCRECTAYYGFPESTDRPIESSINIGNMLFDIAFRKSANRKEMTFIEHTGDFTGEVTGFHQPVFFNGQLNEGIMHVPVSKYKELYELEGLHVKGIG